MAKVKDFVQKVNKKAPFQPKILRRGIEPPGFVFQDECRRGKARAYEG